MSDESEYTKWRHGEPRKESGLGDKSLVDILFDEKGKVTLELWKVREQRDRYRTRALALVRQLRKVRNEYGESEAELTGAIDAVLDREKSTADYAVNLEAERDRYKACLELLNRLGGLGLDKHQWIDYALNPEPSDAP